MESQWSRTWGNDLEVSSLWDRREPKWARSETEAKSGVLERGIGSEPNLKQNEIEMDSNVERHDFEGRSQLAPGGINVVSKFHQIEGRTTSW